MLMRTFCKSKYGIQSGSFSGTEVRNYDISIQVYLWINLWNMVPLSKSVLEQGVLSLNFKKGCDFF